MRGSIRKKGTGYEIRVNLGKDTITGKRKEKSESGFKTKREAEKALAELITRIEKGEFFETEKMSLKEFLLYWLNTYAKVNVAASTFKRYKEFSNTIINYIGTVKLNQLKPSHIQKFYSTLLDESTLSKSTILKIHRMLHLALKHCVFWQMLNYNPSDAVTPPRPDKVDMKVWNEENIKIFFTKSKGESIYMASILALSTGMRQGEICALKWDCIDFNSHTLSVKYTLQKNEGKLELKEPKTKKSIRTIALSEDIVKQLKIYRKEQLAIKLMMGTDYTDNNFVCAWNDGRPLDPHYVCTRFTKIIKAYELPLIRFHDLRHTHATLLLSKGVPAKVVSERLGHSTITITMDTYSHVLPNMQKEAAEKLNGLLSTL